MTAYERSKSAWNNFGKFIHQFQPETKTLIRKLERVLIKLCIQSVSLLFNISYSLSVAIPFPIMLLYSHNHNDIDPTVHIHAQMQTTQFKYRCRRKQADSVVQVRTVLLTSDFGSLTWGERHNSYSANHPQRVAHLVVFKISVGRDPKILTFAITVENSILFAPMAENSTFCLHGVMSTFNSLFFKILKFSGPSLLGHNVIHTPAPFPVWGLLWQWWLSYPLWASIKLYPMTVHLPNWIIKYN